MKELWIQLHEEKIARYLEENPDADEHNAYELCIPTNDEFRDYLADLADRAWSAEKDRRC